MTHEDRTHPEQGRAEDGELFHVLEMPVFRKRYPAALLRPRARHTERIARGLRERLGMRSVLGVAFYPWHDQTTLWWFEQGMLTLLAATGWNTVWITDARYRFDDDRLAEVDGHVSIIRHDRAVLHWEPPDGHFDTVVTLFPCDRATRAARLLGARLITFAIKNLHDGKVFGFRDARLLHLLTEQSHQCLLNLYVASEPRELEPDLGNSDERYAEVPSLT